VLFYWTPGLLETAAPKDFAQRSVNLYWQKSEPLI
jgi:hypothetical protein